MSLLRRHNGIQLGVLLAERKQAGATDKELRRLFGPEPYYWQQLTAPRYRQFKPEWRDQLGREYEQIAENHMAVRLPIAKNREREMEFPLEGQALLLTEVGGGHTLAIEPISLNARRSTGWFEYKER